MQDSEGIYIDTRPDTIAMCVSLMVYGDKALLLENIPKWPLGIDCPHDYGVVYATPEAVPDHDVPSPCGRDNCWLLKYAARLL